MSARYLVRMDDACPTMDHDRWSAVEAVLDRLSIKPLVAVVPENRDPALMVAPPDAAFWERVEGWRDKGWSIAMHGLHHVHHVVAREQLLLPFYDRSEFAGLGLARQRQMIAVSWRMFAARGIFPKVWIAPSHSFDRDTLLALKHETPIRIVSDGLSLRHFVDDLGFTWIPQQLWQPKVRRHGLWTICLHPNSMTDDDVAAFERALSDEAFAGKMARLEDLDLSFRRRDLADALFERYFHARDRAIKAILPLYSLAKRAVARA